jgi:hypothetical protein
MTDAYLPPSEFLKAIIRNQASLTGSETAALNLARLIAMTNWHCCMRKDGRRRTPTLRTSKAIIDQYETELQRLKDEDSEEHDGA